MAFALETEMQHKTPSDADTGAVDTAPVVCAKCGSQDIVAKEISTAFWGGMSLVDLRVIRNIPALACLSCGEEFISDQTAMTIDMMRGGGLRPADAETIIQVPVFLFPVADRAEEKA